MTAAVVAVYLGLVLAGATPQLVAQTPQQHSIQRRSEVREFEPKLSERTASNDSEESTISLPGSDETKQLDLSRSDASLYLALAFAAADSSRTHISTNAVSSAEAFAGSLSSLSERIGYAHLDALASFTFARSVPLARSGLDA